MTDVAKDANRLVKIYRKIRDAREAATAAYNKQDDKYKADLEEVEKLLLKLMDEQNTEGLRTEFGTVSKTIRQRFWTTDWEAFKKFVMKQGIDALDLYEHRLAQKNMAEFIAKHPTQIPAGLQIDRRYAVVVTKPRTKVDED